MIRETWDWILQGRDVRQNLSNLRKEIRERKCKPAVLYHIAGEEDRLVRLLADEDAKTRKNAALLMGDLGKQEFLKPLFEAYEKEKQMFVKSSYLSAIKELDYRECLDALKERLKELTLPGVEHAIENQKHIAEEIRELSSMIITMEGVRMHPFIGYEESYDVILLTNRNFPDLTIQELTELEPETKAKVFGAGVMARVPNLKWASKLRTYQELLFAVKGMQTCPMDAEKAAKTIMESDLLNFLQKAHGEKASAESPYYFRVEFKSKQELDKRSAFTKKLSMNLEKLSGRALLNTTSNYEVELRLIENKAGSCNILLKLYTLPDDRFSYRQEVTPTSLKPVNAALTVALAKEYMKPDAQVLDSFCGVGTMLIERHKAIPANTSYGVDIQSDAIEKARQNTEAAHQIVHYINRDFFDFKHEYLFDEVITDMPFQIGRKTEEEVQELYKRFFQLIHNYVKPQATLILYSHNQKDVQKLAKQELMTIVKEYEISKKEGTYVFVIQCP